MARKRKNPKMRSWRDYGSAKRRAIEKAKEEAAALRKKGESAKKTPSKKSVIERKQSPTIIPASNAESQQREFTSTPPHPRPPRLDKKEHQDILKIVEEMRKIKRKYGGR